MNFDETEVKEFLTSTMTKYEGLNLHLSPSLDFVNQAAGPNLSKLLVIYLH